MMALGSNACRFAMPAAISFNHRTRRFHEKGNILARQLSGILRSQLAIKLIIWIDNSADLEKFHLSSAKRKEPPSHSSSINTGPY